MQTRWEKHCVEGTGRDLDAWRKNLSPLKYGYPGLLREDAAPELGREEWGLWSEEERADVPGREKNADEHGERDIY